MNKHKRYNVGILIGGVHTYFPKEHISGITTAAKELDINVCFFLGTQTQISSKICSAELTKILLIISSIPSTIIVLWEVLMD